MAKAKELTKEIKKLSDLVTDFRNANKGSQRGGGLLESSLQKYGAGRSILTDRNGNIIAGNKTTEAAHSVGLDEDVILVKSDGKRLVVVQRTDLDINSKEARELAIADNRIGELNLDWDVEVLASLVDEGVEIGDMFSDDEMPELLAGLEEPDFEPASLDEQGKLDAIPEHAPEICAVGDAWRLGDHVLHCKDSQGAKEKYDALFYDPPWDIAFTDELLDVPTLAFTDGKNTKQVFEKFGAPEWVFVWNCMTSWYTGNVPLRQNKLCLWYGDIKNYDYNGAHYGDPGMKSKGFSAARGTFETNPDPRGKHLSDVFSLSINHFHLHGGDHKHAKPLDWIRMLIGNCTKGVVYDPFAGSGTAMLACEQLGRKCIAYEIDPKFCDVIIERWQELTGKVATKDE